MATIEKKSSTIGAAPSEAEQLRAAIVKLKADLEEARQKYEEAQRIFCEEALRSAGEREKSTNKLNKHWQGQLDSLKEEHKAEVARVHTIYAAQANNAAGTVSARYN